MRDQTPATQSAALTRAQIRALLALALETPATSCDSPALGGRAAVAQRLLDDMGTRAGERCEGIVARVAREAASLDDLRDTKDLAKRLAASAENRAQSEAAAFLYHLAVAAALCRHGEHISREPLQRQKDVYRRLSRLFQGDVTGHIFEQASQ